MPIWLQLVTALVGAVSSAVMGIAFVPYCEMWQGRYLPKEETKNGTSEDRVRPTLCGVLCMFGCIVAVVVGLSLYLRFCNPDRTEQGFANDVSDCLAGLLFSLFLANIGLWLDLRTCKRGERRPSKSLAVGMLLWLVWMAFLGLLLAIDTDRTTVVNLSIWQFDCKVLYVPMMALLCSGLLRGLGELESHTDGVTVTLGCVEGFLLAMLLLQDGKELLAIWSLALGGACMGCMPWNLPPTRARLGLVGRGCILVSILCLWLLSGHDIGLVMLLLFVLVHTFPRIRGKSLGERMCDEGYRPMTRIAWLVGILLCCSVAVIVIER